VRRGRRLTGRALFAAVAPRLERAHRERRLELAAESLARRRARAQVLDLERLVAHRELQVIRAAGRRGTRRQRERYLQHRENLLRAAEAALARARARAARLGC
jgi:hypothetical protein